MERTQSNSRDYSNLALYRSHGPPNYGKGVKSPLFVASPMKSDFKRGDLPLPGSILYNTECCDTYNVSYDGNYVNPKMLRQKK